jgi:SWI/SNF-related matrix-associated actin-dependent regulator of chromatin subfamily A-like protein 1
LEVPRARKSEIAELMAYRGLVFSTSASSKEQAVLFSDNPYALADLANGECPELAPYREAIDASRALDGKGTTKLPPGEELWPFQKATLDYLLERGGGIDGDAPGCGKTPTAIAFCNEVESCRVLVITTARTRIQWGEKINRWSTIPNVKISVMLNVKDGIHPTAHYQVISYDAARNPNIIRAIAKSRWDVMICDEAHKMKNVAAITSRAILGNSRGEYQHGDEKIPAIGSYAKHKLALTGTPLMNRPSEAYNLFRYFDHESIDYMGEQAFKDKYNKQADLKTLTGKRFKLESTSLELELQNRLRVNIMARHEKRDVMPWLKVPKYGLVHVEESGTVKTALDAEGMLGISIEEIQTTKDIQTLGHIAQVRRLMGIAMAPQIAEYAADFLEGSEEKLVILAWHLEVLDVFQKELAKFGVVRIDGKINARNAQKAVDDFRKNANIRVFIGNIQSAGTGTDGLQEVCTRVYLAEPDWVPSQNEQAVARLDRGGQEGQVTAEIFVAPGSVSEKILVRALEKLNTIFKVLDEKGKPNG